MAESSALVEGPADSVGKVFCPWCGQPTMIRNNHLYCMATDMEFSDWAKTELVAVVDAAPDSGNPLGWRVGRAWYCPADGTQMRQADGVLGCPSCGRSISGKLLYNLIEFHAHPTANTLP